MKKLLILILLTLILGVVLNADKALQAKNSTKFVSAGHLVAEAHLTDVYILIGKRLRTRVA